MFQNLRTSNQIYILHKDGTPFIETGSVVSVSAPHPKYPVSPQLGQLPQMEMVVDITVSVNGQSTSLQGLPAGADIADFGINGNIVVSCSREAMNNEVTTMRQKSLDIKNKDTADLFEQLQRAERLGKGKDTAFKMVGDMMSAYPEEFDALLKKSRAAKSPSSANIKSSGKGGK